MAASSNFTMTVVVVFKKVKLQHFAQYNYTACCRNALCQQYLYLEERLHKRFFNMFYARLVWFHVTGRTI